MNIEQERAEFEAFAQSQWRGINLAWMINFSKYADFDTNTKWITWQASRRAQVVPEHDRCHLCRYQHGHAIGCERNPVDIALAAAPQPPESNSPEFEGIKAAHVPKFNHAARRKLELLQGDGATITGYAIEKDGRRGAIDCHGFVAWWNEAAPVQMPEPFTALVRKKSWSPNCYEASPLSNAKDYGRQWADERINVYTEHQVRQLLAQHGIK